MKEKKFITFRHYRRCILHTYRYVYSLLHNLVRYFIFYFFWIISSINLEILFNLCTFRNNFFFSLELLIPSRHEIRLVLSEILNSFLTHLDIMNINIFWGEIVLVHFLQYKHMNYASRYKSKIEKDSVL